MLSEADREEIVISWLIKVPLWRTLDLNEGYWHEAASHHSFSKSSSFRRARRRKTFAVEIETEERMGFQEMLP